MLCLQVVLLVWLLSRFHFAVGKLINVTIDDTNPGPSGSTITYLPDGAWNLGTDCNVCTAHPDPAQLLDGTWHDGTFNPPGINNFPNQTLTASISFNGTAVYVFCVLARTTTSPDWNSDMTFIIDGESVGTFVKAAPGTTGYDYNVSVFSTTSLSPGAHTLSIQNGHVNGNTSLVILDSIVYSFDDGESDSSSSPPSSSSTSAFSSPTTQSSLLDPSSSSETSTSGIVTAAKDSSPSSSSPLSSSSSPLPSSSSPLPSSSSPLPSPFSVSTSASSSSTTPVSLSDPSSSSKKSKSGIVAAAVVVPVVVVGLAIVAAIFYCRRRRRQQIIHYNHSNVDLLDPPIGTTRDEPVSILATNGSSYHPTPLMSTTTPSTSSYLTSSGVNGKSTLGRTVDGGIHYAQPLAAKGLVGQDLNSGVSGPGLVPHSMDTPLSSSSELVSAPGTVVNVEGDVYVDEDPPPAYV